jgi:hypothetical protein
MPKVAGTFTYLWHGRDVNGQMRTSVNSLFSSASPLYENTIITTGATPNIETLTIDPYKMLLSNGETVKFAYTLSCDAFVTIQLLSPSGNSITVLTGQLQSAGQQEMIWNGLDPIDTTLKKFAVSEEGYYTVDISAVNTINGTSSTAQGILYIGL